MKYRTTVYIAAPPDQVVEVRRVAARLYEHGYSPIYRVSSEDPPGLTDDQRLELSLPWLAVSEKVLRIPGSSTVADREVKAAFGFGITVYKSVDALLVDSDRGDQGEWAGEH